MRGWGGCGACGISWTAASSGCKDMSDSLPPNSCPGGAGGVTWSAPPSPLFRLLPPLSRAQYGHGVKKCVVRGRGGKGVSSLAEAVWGGVDQSAGAEEFKEGGALAAEHAEYAEQGRKVLAICQAGLRGRPASRANPARRLRRARPRCERRYAPPPRCRPDAGTPRHAAPRHCSWSTLAVRSPCDRIRALCVSVSEREIYVVASHSHPQKCAHSL